MASFTINIPDAELTDWLNAYSQGRPPDSELTKAQWAKREIQVMLRGVVRAYRERQAANSVENSEATIT